MKKIIPIIIAILIIIIISYIILFFINKSNINNNVDPVFYFSKQIANDGGSTIYNVLLYKIIKYKNIDNDNDVIYEIGGPNLEFNNPFHSY